MKTILEHLETLPEPYRSEAIENTSKHQQARKVEHITDAIYEAFFWHQTPQGLEYWERLADSL